MYSKEASSVVQNYTVREMPFLENRKGEIDMNYDKGPQLTVYQLKSYLKHIPDDVKICIGIGSDNAPAHYLLNYAGQLMIHSDCYMQNATETNIKTVLSFNARKEE